MNYKVYLSSSSKAKSLKAVTEPCLVAIEPEDFTAKQVAELKKKGYTVLGYISLGSVSDERDYYMKLKPYTLGRLEDWEHEKYLDIRNDAVKKWAKSRAKEIAAMGFDGLWVDNLDVYEYYKSPELFNAIVEALNSLKSIAGYIMINGGSEFISELITKKDVLYRVQIGAFGSKKNAQYQKSIVKNKGFDAIVVQDGGYYKVQVGAFSKKDNAEARLNEIKRSGFENAIIVEKKTNYNCVDGYTQEEVFSLIVDYSGKGKFGKQSSEDSNHYKEVISNVRKNKINTFLLEYTRDKAIKEKIMLYCRDNGITGYYISEDVNL